MSTLQQPELPTRRWSHIAIDIVNGFPSVTYNNSTVNAVLVIIDIFSSHVHFHPINFSFSGSDLAHLLLHQHFPLHGFPEILVSDRGSQFTSLVYQQLLNNLGSTSRLSVSKHHESNGNVERYIRILQDYLITTITENSQWISMLPMAEFVINSTPTISLGGLSPFEADLGYIPASPLSIQYSTTTSGAAADDITEAMDRFYTTARSALQLSFQKNKLYFDASKTTTTFQVGDQAYIKQSALSTAGNSHNSELVSSFRTKFVGPVTVTEVLSPVNVLLALPASFKRKSPFHISQLRKQKSLPDALFKAPATQHRSSTNTPMAPKKLRLIQF